MSAEQENTRQIVLEIAGVTDATRVDDLTVRQFVELIIRVYGQLPVRRVPPGQRAVDEAITEIRRLLGSLDEAFQRVQAAILSELPARTPDLVAAEPVLCSRIGVDLGRLPRLPGTMQCSGKRPARHQTVTTHRKQSD